MKAFANLGAVVLVLSLGTIVPAFGQHGQEEAKPEQKQQQEHAQPQQQHAQQQQRQPQQQNQQKQQAAQQQNHNNQQQNQQKQQAAQQQNHNNQQQHQQQAQQQNHNNQQQHQQQAQRSHDNQQQHAQQQNHNNQQPIRHTQEQQRVQQAAWQGHQSQNWQSDHRTWEQRGGYHGYRIPENRYNGYFGPNYAFVIYSQPYMVVGGFPRFRHGGYWFTLVDPWPGYWSNNWYETDDVYVVYANNGYYMYNQRHPGVGIAISVSM